MDYGPLGKGLSGTHSVHMAFRSDLSDMAMLLFSFPYTVSHILPYNSPTIKKFIISHRQIVALDLNKL